MKTNSSFSFTSSYCSFSIEKTQTYIYIYIYIYIYEYKVWFLLFKGFMCTLPPPAPPLLTLAPWRIISFLRFCSYDLIFCCTKIKSGVFF